MKCLSSDGRGPAGAMLVALAMLSTSLARSALAQGGPEVAWASYSPGYVEAIAVSPDGETIGTSDLDELRLWDRATGVFVAEIPYGETALLGVAFAPDGESVYTCGGWWGSRIPNIRRWSLRDGALRREYDVPVESVTAIDISADGTLIAAESGWEDDCCDGDGLNLIRADTGEIIRTWPWIQGGDVALNPDATLVAAVSSGVKIFRISDGELVRELHFDEYPEAVAYSRDGATLGVAVGDRVELYDPTGNPVRTINGHTGMVTDLNFSPDSQLVASISPCTSDGDCTARLWRVADGAPAWGQPVTTENGRFIVFASPSEVVTAGGNGVIQRWSVQTGQLVGERRSDVPGDLFALEYDPHNEFVAGIDSAQPGIQVWRAADGERLAGFDRAGQSFHSIAISPDARLLAAADPSASNPDPSVVIWDVATRQIIHEIATDRVSAITFAPDGMLATGTYARSNQAVPLVRLWNADTGASLGSIDVQAAPNASVASLAYSATGLLAVGLGGGDVVLIRVPEGEEIARWPAAFGNKFTTVAFSPNARWLAVALDYPRLQVFDMKTTALAYISPPNQSWADALRFSSDGQYIVSTQRFSEPHLDFLRVGTWETAWSATEGVGNRVSSIAFAPHSNSYALGRSGLVMTARSPFAPCRADWDLSGTLDSADFYALLDDFFDGTADYNRDGVVNSQDFFDFLAAFFAGCG